MAQLRHNIDQFTALHTKIMVLVPNGSFMINLFLKRHPTPYPILSDKGSIVADQYFQVKKFLLIGTPSVFIVQKGGKIAYTHYADSLIAKPGLAEPLAILSQINNYRP
jgi:peroxiredoxin